MRDRFTSIAALLVLAVMAFQCVHLASFEVRRISLREAMKRRIADGPSGRDLVHFTFTEQAFAALPKEDRGRECWIGGQLYDLVSLQYGSDGLVHLRAVPDHEEGLLMEALSELLRNLPSDGPVSRQLAAVAVDALADAMPGSPVHCPLPPAGQGLRRVLPEPAPDEGALQGLLRPPRA